MKTLDSKNIQIFVLLADKKFNMKRKVFFIVLYIVLVAIIRLIYNKNESLHRGHFTETHRLEVREIREKLQHEVALIYQGLRTISRLPGVKKMDMTTQALTSDAERSVQEIYNNLNLSIRLSEVYLVPIDLDPDKVDTRTNKLQAPLVSFDSVQEKYDRPIKHGKKGDHSVEIFEYRVMREQNMWLKKYFPHEKYITNFEVPMLSGKEVITCDNENFDPNNPDDKRRSGQVFSVPFYDETGNLKGTVAGVVLTDVLAAHLPNEKYHIESAINQYSIGKTAPTEQKLAYHERIKLDFNDPNADWYLISSVPESLLMQDEDILQTRYLYYLSLFFCSVLVLITYFMVEQNVKLISSQQKALETSAQLASMGEMTASIAHEINNPLSIIVTKATLMKAMNEKGTLTKERITSDLDKLKSTAERIAKIIKGLKALSRNAESDPYEKLSIKQVINDSLEFCLDRLKERGIELRLKNDLDELVSCREVQLSQVIINLVNNASDAILELPEKWIDLEVTKDQQKKIILITVTDSGNGIPPEIAKKLMTPFFSTKGVGKGTGLGLSISRKIIQQHGGELRLDHSHPHTRFVIELPV